MKRIALAFALGLGFSTATHAEIHPLNIFKLLRAKAAGKHERARQAISDPVIRARRIPLQDVRSCATGDSACVILNGRRIELEAAPMGLLHQRVQVVGRVRGSAQTGVFAKVRFSSWASSEPDYLLIWASIRNSDRRVKIQGYTVDRDDKPGVEYVAPQDFGNYNFMKYLTSTNPLEIEIARELTERYVFCSKYPAEPLDTIRDEVSPLQRAGMIGSADAQHRLTALQSVAATIDIGRGQLMCDSPITDQVDGVLDQVREALEGYAKKLPNPKAPPKPVEPPKVEPAPAKPVSPPSHGYPKS